MTPIFNKILNQMPPLSLFHGRHMYVTFIFECPPPRVVREGGSFVSISTQNALTDDPEWHLIFEICSKVTYARCFDVMSKQM